jgi:hypothetical protein
MSPDGTNNKKSHNETAPLRYINKIVLRWRTWSRECLFGLFIHALSTSRRMQNDWVSKIKILKVVKWRHHIWWRRKSLSLNLLTFKHSFWFFIFIALPIFSVTFVHSSHFLSPLFKSAHSIFGLFLQRFLVLVTYVLPVIQQTHFTLYNYILHSVLFRVHSLYTSFYARLVCNSAQTANLFA